MASTRADFDSCLLSGSARDERSRRIGTGGAVLAAYALAGGLLTLLGWSTRSPRLTDWVGTGIAMFANTAVAAACAGLSILLSGGRPWARLLARGLGFVVLALGGATVFQHLTGLNLGIDTLLVREPWGIRAATSPGRMGPPASTCFTLLGLALTLLQGGPRARKLASAAGVAVAAISMLSLIGYVYGAKALFSTHWSGIAFQTATMLFTLGLAVVMSVPEVEPALTFSRQTSAGMLARRTLPAIVVAMLLLGWLRVRGQQAELYDSATGTAAHVLVSLLLLSTLLWLSIRAVAQRERALRNSETELRQAQQKLMLHAAELESTVAQRTAELRDTVNELQTFSYSIAHDMRSPLRAMGMFARLLVEESCGLSPAGLDYARRIATAARRLDSLIEDSLNYTKSVLQEYPLRPVNLAEFVQGLIDTYPNLHSDKADVRVEGTLPSVVGNEALLTQCFSNLLGNAVKFVAPGTRPCVTVRAETLNGTARIAFQDNGIGIPKDLQHRLFGMFEKLDADYEGSGIGLALVRKAAERMKGKVGVESEEGRGSLFWVELPVAAGAREEARPSE